jgi:hypothetical protein
LRTHITIQPSIYINTLAVYFYKTLVEYSHKSKKWSRGKQIEEPVNIRVAINGVPTLMPKIGFHLPTNGTSHNNYYR